MRELRLALMGSSRVGKTQLISRFVNSRFSEDYDPTIEDLHTSDYVVDGRPAKLQILDTKGIEHFHAMRELYIENSYAFALVYDVTNKASLSELDELHAQIRRTKGDSAPIVIVGNKIDRLDRATASTQVSKAGAKLATRLGVPHILTSAQSGMRAAQPFEALVRMLRKQDPAFGHLEETQSLSSASIDGWLYTPSERAMSRHHQPTLKRSVLKLKRSMAKIREAKSVRNLRHAVSVSFTRTRDYQHSSSPIPHLSAGPTGKTSMPMINSNRRGQMMTLTDGSGGSGSDRDAAASGKPGEHQQQLRFAADDGLDPSVDPVTQSNLDELPDILDVSAQAQRSPKHRGICVVM